MSTVKNSIRSAHFRAQLLRDVAADNRALELLSDSTTPESQIKFADTLLTLIPPALANNLEKPALFRSFLGWSKDQSLSCPENLKAAIAMRENHKMKQRKVKRNYIDRLGLNWERPKREEYLARIPTTTVSQLDAPYPPLGHWIFESDEIKKKWQHWILEAPQADSRKKRLPMLKLDPHMLVHDIDDKTSMIFQKEDGGLAGLVIRDFCPDGETLKWLDTVIEGAAGVRKNIRVRSDLSSICIPLISQILARGPRNTGPNRILCGLPKFAVV
jgi:hypothetical protein